MKKITFLLCFLFTSFYSINVMGQICDCENFNLINGGFEQPGGVSTYIITPQSNVPGWSSTDPGGIEIWRSGFNGFSDPISVPSYEGGQFAELNAYVNASLFQDVNTCPGQTYDWEVAHRGRDGAETALVEFGPPGGPYTSVETMEDGTSAWGFYSGSYEIPEGQNITRIRLTALTYISNPAKGNFVDGFVLTPNNCNDPDGDGVTNDIDNCPDDVNPGQEDNDNDGIGDVCDSDDDNDGILDVDDTCPFSINTTNGVVEDVVIKIGTAGQAINILTPPVGEAPFTYNFGLQGAYLGSHLISTTTGVDPNDPSTFPTVQAVNISPWFINSGAITFYLLNVVDANGCAAGDTYKIQFKLTPADADGDGIVDKIDNCPDTPNADQANNDGDAEGDVCDDDDDNDGTSDADEIACGSDPSNAASTCEVCDGLDNDLDGDTDEGFIDTDGDLMADCVDPDDDNDGVLDGDDSAPLDNFICQDLDGDGCDDCASGTVDAANDGLDTDGDGLCDLGDTDDDNDGIDDECDSNPLVDNFTFNGVENLPAEWLCGNNAKNQKVYVCHIPPGNPANVQTICVSPNAVQAHLDHGCMLGECYSCPGSNFSGNPNSGSIPNTNVDIYHIELEVFPNPAKDKLNIHLHGDEIMVHTQIIIYDNLGRVVLEQNLEEYQTTLEIDLSNNKFKTGIYIINMISGENIISKPFVISK